jgi:hypothetical protein
MHTEMRVRALALLIAVATGGPAGCNHGKAADAQKEADAEAAAKAAKEADDQASAARKAARSNAETKKKLQKEIDAGDRRAVYLKEKAAKASGVTKKSADAAIADIDTREATAKVDMAKLDPDDATSWDTQRSAVEADIAAVKKAVDSLETIVEAK